MLLVLTLVATGCKKKNSASSEQTTTDTSDTPDTTDTRDTSNTSHVKIIFEDSEAYAFTDAEKKLIVETAESADREIRSLLPDLTKDLTLKVLPVAFDLDIVGGITGRASTPHEVTAEISYVYKDGVSAAIKRTLAAHMHHEFHHVWRGWTLTENEFEKGIPIAAVNEGLADVFSRTYTGFSLEIGSPSDDLDAWAQEILALPVDANYNKWMNIHDDGRIAIGYRVGSHIVEQAMENSGMNILALSELPPNEILALSGVVQTQP